MAETAKEKPEAVDKAQAASEFEAAAALSKDAVGNALLDIGKTVVDAASSAAKTIGDATGLTSKESSNNSDSLIKSVGDAVTAVAKGITDGTGSIVTEATKWLSNASADNQLKEAARNNESSLSDAAQRIFEEVRSTQPAAKSTDNQTDSLSSISKSLLSDRPATTPPLTGDAQARPADITGTTSRKTSPDQSIGSIIFEPATDKSVNGGIAKATIERKEPESKVDGERKENPPPVDASERRGVQAAPEQTGRQTGNSTGDQPARPTASSAAEQPLKQPLGTIPDQPAKVSGETAAAQPLRQPASGPADQALRVGPAAEDAGRKTPAGTDIPARNADPVKAELPTASATPSGGGTGKDSTVDTRVARPESRPDAPPAAPQPDTRATRSDTPPAGNGAPSSPLAVPHPTDGSAGAGSSNTDRRLDTTTAARNDSAAAPGSAGAPRESLLPTAIPKVADGTSASCITNSDACAAAGRNANNSDARITTPAPQPGRDPSVQAINGNPANPEAARNASESLKPGDSRTVPSQAATAPAADGKAAPVAPIAPAAEAKAAALPPAVPAAADGRVLAVRTDNSPANSDGRVGAAGQALATAGATQPGSDSRTALSAPNSPANSDAAVREALKVSVPRDARAVERTDAPGSSDNGANPRMAAGGQPAVLVARDVFGPNQPPAARSDQPASGLVELPRATNSDANSRSAADGRNGGSLPTADSASRPRSTETGGSPSSIDDRQKLFPSTSSAALTSLADRAGGPDSSLPRSADNNIRSVNGTAFSANGSGDRAPANPAGLPAGAEALARQALAPGADRLASAAGSSERGNATGPSIDRTTALPQDRFLSLEQRLAVSAATDAVGRVADSSRIQQALERILDRNPEWRHLPRELMIREVLRQLVQDGVIGSTTGLPSPRALEIVRMLLESREGQAQTTAPSVQHALIGQRPERPHEAHRGARAHQVGSDSPAGGHRISLTNQSGQSGPASDPSPSRSGNAEAAARSGDSPFRTGDNTARDGFRSADGNGYTASRSEVSAGSRGADSSTSRSEPSSIRAEGDRSRNDSVFQSGSDRAVPSHGQPASVHAGPGREHGGAKDPSGKHQPGSDKSASESVSSDRQPSSSVRHDCPVSSHNGPRQDFAGRTGGSEGDRQGLDRRETIDKSDNYAPESKRPGPAEGTGWIEVIAGALLGVAKASDKKTGSGRKPAGKASQDSERRTRHLVRFGDSLELIAGQKLGDIRFATLLLTINRASIRFKADGNRRLPDLEPGQILWLPTSSELARHRQTFFGASPSSGTQSAQPIVPQEETALPAPLLFTPPALEIVDGSLTVAGSKSGSAVAQPAQSSPIALILYRLRHAGNRPSVQLPAPVKAVHSPTSETSEPGVEARMFITKLAESCRVVLTQAGENDLYFNTRLQANIEGRWTTIAAYESGQMRATRYVYGSDGKGEPLEMNLPPAVVREMAREDFSRNWQSYYQRFTQKARSEAG